MSLPDSDLRFTLRTAVGLLTLWPLAPRRWESFRLNRSQLGRYAAGRGQKQKRRYTLPSCTFYGTLSTVEKRMEEDLQPHKIPLIFYRTPAGSEPVRAWLKELEEAERHAIGRDLLRAQWRWPVGMPLCRSIGKGLWEIRTELPTKRTARVLLCVYCGHLVALHGFIKKTRAMPDEDMALARKRQKELER